MQDITKSAKYLLIAGTALVLTACADKTKTQAPAPAAEPVEAVDTVPAEPVAPVDAELLDAPEEGSQEALDQAADDALVYFGYDRYDLSAEARTSLQAQAAWLNDNPSVTITVEGHCDERGTREYNLALGDRRATSVKNYLVALGVNPSRVRTVSYGKERPMVTGSGETSWAQNRRGKTRVN